MEVRFDDFGANVPRKPRYVRGVDFLAHEFDLDVEDTFYLVTHLKNNRSSVCVFTDSAMVDFYVFDGELNVQIDGTGSGFWHGSSLDQPTAKAVLKVAFEGRGDFGWQIPGTNRPWDVY